MIRRGIVVLVFMLCVQGLQAASSPGYSDTTFLYRTTEETRDSLMQHDTVPEEVLAEKAESLFGKLFKYMPVPYLGYSTETSLTFGIIKYNAFKFRNRNLPDSLMQLSSVSLYGFYTLNKQYEIKLKGDLMFGPNRFNTVFEFTFRDFPMLYFGVGNDTPEENGVLTDFKNLLLKPGFNYNIAKNNYLGFRYIFDNYLHVYPRDTVPEYDLEGNEGIQSGFGLIYFREARDNRLEPKRGSYIYFSADLFDHIFGSKFDYGNFTVDLRKYYTVFGKLTMAGQLYSEIRLGDVPVQSLSLVGGKYRMRGIYQGRFRDKTLAMGQVELRFPLFWVIGGAAFAGMGQVQPHFSDFKGNGFHYAGGGGLRICMDKKTSSVLRVDVGFSKGGHTVFLGFGEAF